MFEYITGSKQTPISQHFSLEILFVNFNVSWISPIFLIPPHDHHLHLALGRLSHLWGLPVFTESWVQRCQSTTPKKWWGMYGWFTFFHKNGSTRKLWEAMFFSATKAGALYWLPTKFPDPARCTVVSEYPPKIHITFQNASTCLDRRRFSKMGL